MYGVKLKFENITITGAYMHVLYKSTLLHISLPLSCGLLMGLTLNFFKQNKAFKNTKKRPLQLQLSNF